MFIAKLIVFCVYFVYALITCGCLFRFISCIVYLWLMFLRFAWCYVIMLSNLSGFVNKFSPVDQFLCPLFKKLRCRSFPCKSLYSPIAQREHVCIFTEAHCVSLGFLWLDVKDWRYQKSHISLLTLPFFYPKTKFRTVLRYFELLFYYIITFFLTKKYNGSPGSAGSAGSAGFAGSGGSTVCWFTI